MDNHSWMTIALEMAERSLKAGEVPVGCLFIYENKVIASGNNRVNETHNATRHAEINCIDQVLDFCKTNRMNYAEVFPKIDVIVTVEPCIMCTAALYTLKIRSIIYGCANDRFGGCISVFPVPPIYGSNIKIIGGVQAEKAITFLKIFYKGTNPNVPACKAKKIQQIQKDNDQSNST